MYSQAIDFTMRWGCVYGQVCITVMNALPRNNRSTDAFLAKDT